MKFVIQDRADYEFAREVVIAATICRGAAAAVLLSPVHGVLRAARSLSEWMLADRAARLRGSSSAAQVSSGTPTTRGV